MSIRTIEHVMGNSLFLSISFSFISYVHPQKLDIFLFIFLSISWIISFCLIFITFKEYKQNSKSKKQDSEKKEFILEHDDNENYLKLHTLFKKEDSL